MTPARVIVELEKERDAAIASAAHAAKRIIVLEALVLALTGHE